MAVTSGSRLQFEYMLGGGVPALVSLPEANDSTGWDQGTICIIDTSGHVTKQASGNCATGAYCVSLSSMSSTADGSVTKPFLLITPNTVFSAVCAHATTASAVPQATNVGNSFYITNSATVCPSTNVWVMDMAGSGNIGGYVIANKDTTGTAYGRNFFIFAGTYGAMSPFGWSTVFYSLSS